MPRSLVLGNGKTLLGLDQFGRVRDLYFPHVGLENQVRGRCIHKIGVWVDGKISWFGDDSNWQIEVKSRERALVGETKAVNQSLEVSIEFTDVVYNEECVFVRKIKITNNSGKSRDIKLYLGHQFELYESDRADTSYFDPARHTIVHYKGQRVFMINGEIEHMPFSDYTVGLANFKDKEGSHRDADDGALSKNPIEHGPADSIIGFYSIYSGRETKTIHYWMVGAKSIKEAGDLNSMVIRKTPDHIIRTTSDYWKAWVERYEWSFHKLSKEVVELFNRSLLIIRAHVDDEGAIIASSDSDMLNQGKDTYAYMWPRDAAFSATALDRAGDPNVAMRFFEFAKAIINEEGYFMHKYLADKSLGSSWHPWIRDGAQQFPIQEDETALVIWALYEHYLRSKDLEFIENNFNSVIEKAANFMLNYRDKTTKLPKPSYDLWEEKYGTSTFTSAAVYGALSAAANFSHLLGKNHHEKNYRDGAEEIKAAIMKHLYNEKTGNFYKLINVNGKTIDVNETIDISAPFGVFNFGVLHANDPKLKRAFEQAISKLSRGNKIGGVPRYENDNYYKVAGDTEGNPWIITTLWCIQFDIAKAQTESEFDDVRNKLSWIARYATPSGILSEQLDPYTGAQVSAAPLTWSHAEYVSTILKYLDRLEQLKICDACNPVP